MNTATTSAACATMSNITRETGPDWKACLFDDSEDALIVCDRAGTIVELNTRASRLLGIPSGTDEGKRTFEESLTAGSWRRLRVLLERASGGAETMPGVSLMARGRLAMLADLQVARIAGECSLVTVRDASRRWRMESHVHRLVSAIDSSRDVVYLTDAQGHITFVNAAFQSVTGHTIEEVLGQPASVIRLATEAGKSLECERTVSEGKDWAGEFQNQRKDGSTYPVETVVSPIFGKQGEFIGGAAFERDVTAKRDLQRQLVVERDFVSNIINSLDAAVYTLDRSFCLTHFNDGWKRLPACHGWLTLDEPLQIGRPFLRYVNDPERQAELQTLFDLVLRRCSPEEIHAASADQGHHWMMRISPLWHEGEVSGLIYVVTDQSYLYQLQSQLYQAQKMETVGTLAAGVAHDFNNLLLAIRGNVSLLQMNAKFPSELRPRLDSIDKAANRAADVTQQLLSFSRASEERETVLNFNEVVADACDLARRTLKGKVRVKLDLDSQAMKVKIDNTRAQQAILNLCVNARDAMPEGGELEIRTRAVCLNTAQSQKASVKPGASFICCSVKDTGTGIPVELLPRIFDPFFTTKEKGKGTGLGLAIVHNVVSKAGGILEVESVPGRGTTFHLFFPAATEGLTMPARESDRPMVRGTGRVLVVDDLDLVREYTQSLLSEAGYEVEVASSAEEALSLLLAKDGGFNLVFTDYNMAGKSGWQLIREASKQWPTLKFILATGYLEEDERDRIEREGKVRILNKPFQMKAAVEAVACVIGEPSVAAAA